MGLRDEQLRELLYQALETEIQGQAIYKAAIACADDDDLREEWREYLEQTESHERILRTVFDRLKLDPEMESLGREVVRLKAEALVSAMHMALEGSGPAAAQLVAAESVIEAESKDLQNWELIGRVAEEASGERKQALQEAYDEVSDEEAEHLYHTMGWSRELWLKSLGLPAMVPPPEEKKGVKTAIGAARAVHKREEMLEESA